MRQAFKQLLKSDSVISALALMLIASLLAFSGVLNRLDGLAFDLGRYFAHKAPPSDIVIVAVDEKSLSNIGRWPWSRDVHTALIDQLAKEKPAVIGLDILFSEPELTTNTTQVSADADLQAAIKNASNVVLPALFEVPFAGAPIKLSLPLPILAEAAAALGRVHVPLDADGLARGIYLHEALLNKNSEDSAEKLNGFSQTHPYSATFAAAILQVAAQLPPAFQTTLSPNAFLKQFSQLSVDQSSGQIIREEFRLMNFSGPPGHFQRISYSDVLVGNYPKHYFNNKIVLVGATAVGLGDVLPTAVSALSQPMPGVEFHANVIEAMRTNSLIKPFSSTSIILCSALLAMMPIFWLRKLSPSQSLLVIVFYFIGIILVVLLIAYFFQWWLPPASALIAVILAYPLWSWRKLESAQRYLDDELLILQTELANVGADDGFLIASNSQDAMQSRIHKVKHTAQKLRSLHHERDDTLAFISHDLRAPLGSAMLLMENIENHQNIARAKQMLHRANAMAEQFLQVSRAEMANQHSFQLLELLGLLQQVQDDAYAAIKQKALHLKFISSATEIWVLGDFGLLQRALANVLSNAIKYAPSATVITIEVALFQDNNEFIVSVTDCGAGIEAERVSRLFKRFSRAEGANQSVDGTGLGLYFVHTVFKKHQGDVTVISQAASQPLDNENLGVRNENLATYTTFKLKLPLATL